MQCRLGRAGRVSATKITPADITALCNQERPMERRSEREKRGRGGHCEWKGNTREEARGGRGEEQREIYISRGACIRSGLFIFRNMTA